MQFFDTNRALGVVTSLLVAAVALVLVSCDGISSGSGNPTADLDEPLSISGVQYQHADSVDANGDPLRPDTLNPGARVAIQGNNMNSVANVYFLGYEVDFNPALASENYLIVTVPGDLPFGELSTEEVEGDSIPEVQVTNSASEARYDDAPVRPPAPVLEGMSNEYADPGEQVTLSGSFLYLVQSVTLPDGTTVPGEEVEATTDGTEAVFTIPEGASPQEGAITYTTASGTGESPPTFVYRDSRGMLLNWDDHTSWQGWNAMVTASDTSSFGSGAEGSFAVLQGSGEIPGGGDNAWYSANRSINMNNQQWVAPENLGEAAANFALKFELNIQQEWAAGSILIHLIETSDGYSSGYGYRVKPWEQSDGSVSPVSWDGWRTITAPLSQFRDSYGANDGSTPSSLTDLFGGDGVVGNGGPDNNPPAFRLVNYSSSVIPAGQAFAVDNVRVVRIAGGD